MRARLPLAVALVTAAALLPAAGTTGGAAAAPAATTVARSTAVAQFSHPTVLPLRTPARISCVKSNCRLSDGRVYHGDWAIDFLGKFGDPVYAAGSGVAHVGGRLSGCRTDEGERRGNWVWIDHSAGEVTYYYHLQSIAITDGQRVTPATRIGAMGSSGAGAPCAVPYLHFERRITTDESRRVAPGTMWACQASGPVAYPQSLGEVTWDVPKLKYWVSSASTTCLPAPAAVAAPGRPVVSRVSGNRAATVSWAPSSGATGYRLSVAIWHPSTGEWDEERLVSAPTTGTVLVAGLLPRRTYRLKVAAWGAAANSSWSPTVTAVMADPPQAPPITKVTPARSSARVVWRIPANGGNGITAYTAVLTDAAGVVVRRLATRPTVREVTFAGLLRKTTYRVAVTAANQVGTSAASRRTLRTT